MSEILKQSIKNQINSDELTIATIAKKLGVKVEAIRAAMRRNAEYLVNDVNKAAIKEVLGIPSDEEITEAALEEVDRKL